MAAIQIFRKMPLQIPSGFVMAIFLWTMSIGAEEIHKMGWEDAKANQKSGCK